VKKAYRTIRTQGKVNEQELASFLVKNGQGLLPMVDLIEQCQIACNELIDVTGRAAIQAVLQLSAMEAAGGPPQQGKRRSGDVVFYGRQAGQVFLSDRKVEVERPRLRRKRPRSQEVEVPAYSAMQDQEQMGARMLDILLHGVSTRNYKAVIPAMAETAGVSRSAVSRAAIEASEAEVEALLSRRFDDLKLLVIYVDGLVFGKYTMIGAVGVDTEGHKHVLGIREGATENAAVVTALLEDIVARGLDPKRKMLFVIDGSKALRAAINAVLGKHADVLFDTVSALIGQVQSGQLKALAVTGKDRFAAVPNVPAAIESGVLPGYDVTTWYGVFAPKGTPPAVVAKLNKVLIDSLKEEEVAKRMATVGVVVKTSTPDEFGNFLASENKLWNAVREAAGIQQQ